MKKYSQPLEEAIGYFNQMKFSRLHGDFAESDFVMINIQPSNGPKVLVSCSNKQLVAGYNPVNWSDIELAVLQDGEEIIRKRINEDGQVWLEKIKRGKEYSLRARVIE